MPFGIGDDDYTYEPNMTWDHLTFIREHTPGLPVLVKGILTAEDARLAVEQGAEGSWCRTTVVGSSIRARPRSTRCPKWSRRSAAGCRS